MPFPSRRARVALLAGCATLAAAAPAAAAPSAEIDAAGTLKVTYSGGEAVTLGAQNGNVKLGAAELTIPVASVKTIEVLEDAAGTEANAVDLSGVTAADYTQLTSTLIKAAGGADTLTGTQLGDRIEAGRQNDTMNGRDGDDTLVWNNGDGSDVMNGGDGIDTIESNGAPGDEVYTAETDGPKLLFRRTSAGPFSLTVGGAERYVNNLLGGNDRFSTLDPAKPVTGIAVTLNGGEGNDALTGTDGADTLNGGPGDDGLTGFRGNDTAGGDDGDDLIVWNPGDDSDKQEGGAGTDTAQLNGGGAGEHFVVTRNGARVTATRDAPAPFFLDIGTSELLDLNGNAGDDSVDVGNGVGAVLATDFALGEGNDSIRARNDSVQKIDGGNGADSAQVDATDQVTNVEAVDVPDTTAPQVGLVSRSAALRKGKARLVLSCPAGESTCGGRVKLVRGGKVVGSRAFTLKGGHTKAVKVAVARKARIALARSERGRIGVEVRITATDAAGNTGRSSARLRLKG